MSKKTLLAGVLPFITNPVVLAVVSIGAIGLTVYEIFSDNKEGQGNGSEAVPDGSPPLFDQLNNEVFTVPETVLKPSETVEVTVRETVHSAVDEPYASKFHEIGNSASLQDETISEEELKKEVIRQAMSELGKRSAAARAKRKYTI